MSNGRAIRMQFEPLRSIAFGSIPTGTFVGGEIGTALSHGIVGFKVDNLTDALCIFSIDGINEHFPVPANGFYVLDIATNAGSQVGFFMAKGDAFYVKYSGSAPSSGSVYVSVIYGDTGLGTP